MLEDLRKFGNLATSGYYWELFSLLHSQPDESWDKKALDDHFKGRIIDGNSEFDGGLHLLLVCGVLEIDVAGVYRISFAFRQQLHTLDHCRGKVLEALMAALKDDDETYSIFSPEYCTIDLVNNVIQINKSAFGLKHSNIRDALIDLGFLIPHPNFPDNSYAVNKPHRKLFDRYLTDEIRRRQVTPDELLSMQAKQQENGLIGEKYVMNYEMQRTQREDVEWIATYDVNAGFDILSFESESSEQHDRFIEVKAYSGNKPYFYWSRNEIETAKEKGDEYFLYLVNLEEIDDGEYSPIMIKNPAESVLENAEWDKSVEKYRIVSAI